MSCVLILMGCHGCGVEWRPIWYNRRCWHQATPRGPHVSHTAQNSFLALGQWATSHNMPSLPSSQILHIGSHRPDMQETERRCWEGLLCNQIISHDLEPINNKYYVLTSSQQHLCWLNMAYPLPDLDESSQRTLFNSDKRFWNHQKEWPKGDDVLTPFNCGENKRPD